MSRLSLRTKEHLFRKLGALIRVFTSARMACSEDNGKTRCDFFAFEVRPEDLGAFRLRGALKEDWSKSRVVRLTSKRREARIPECLSESGSRLSASPHSCYMKIESEVARTKLNPGHLRGSPPPPIEVERAP